MARFLVDVPVEDVRKLDEIAKREGKSRAAVLREAVANYLALGNDDWLVSPKTEWIIRTGCATSGFANGTLNMTRQNTDL
jgi:predicted transcriptional regulator